VTTPSADDARPATAGRAAAPESGPSDSPPAGGQNGDQPLLRLVGVGKNFGPVRALTDINLDVPLGQVTALVGDNGAGKSTLIKTIAGIWPQDHGEILWEGKPVRFHSPRDAADLGIATVYQDLALADNLDIVQNMFLGRQPVGSLSGGQRQAVAVARAVLRQARLVILDEPTAALGVTQTRVVLELIQRLKGQGIAVIIISHNLTDVMAVADRVAVLRLGQLVSVGPLARYDAQSIVELMTTGTSGRLAAAQAEPSAQQPAGSSSEH
jgi:ABC-type sugar transport system ATPase subunit